jgi:hypothetical protein
VLPDSAEIPSAAATSVITGFTAMLLNPAVAKVQRRFPRRGLAAAADTSPARAGERIPAMATA